MDRSRYSYCIPGNAVGTTYSRCRFLVAETRLKSARGSTHTQTKQIFDIWVRFFTHLKCLFSKSNQLSDLDNEFSWKIGSLTFLPIFEQIIVHNTDYVIYNDRKVEKGQEYEKRRNFWGSLKDLWYPKSYTSFGLVQSILWSSTGSSTINSTQNCLTGNYHKVNNVYSSCNFHEMNKQK